MKKILTLMALASLTAIHCNIIQRTGLGLKRATQTLYTLSLKGCSPLAEKFILMKYHIRKNQILNDNQTKTNLGTCNATEQWFHAKIDALEACNRAHVAPPHTFYYYDYPWVKRIDLKNRNLNHLHLKSIPENFCQQFDISNTHVKNGFFYDIILNDKCPIQAEGADFTGSLFMQTCFEGGNFRNAKLQGVTMCSVNLSGADLTGADVTNACIDEIIVDHRGLTLPDGTKCYGNEHYRELLKQFTKPTK